ncbi:MAG: hypothetical protein AAF202_00390, partial [Pseudomonadota bacterium]
MEFIIYADLIWVIDMVPSLQRTFLSSAGMEMVCKRISTVSWEGGESHLGPNSEASGLGLVQFDIENRDYYFLAKSLVVGNSDRADLNQAV